jgi:hypothetical protein
MTHLMEPIGSVKEEFLNFVKEPKLVHGMLGHSYNLATLIFCCVKWTAVTFNCWASLKCDGQEWDILPLNVVTPFTTRVKRRVDRAELLS